MTLVRFPARESQPQGPSSNRLLRQRVQALPVLVRVDAGGRIHWVENAETQTFRTSPVGA